MERQPVGPFSPAPAAMVAALQQGAVMHALAAGSSKAQPQAPADARQHGERQEPQHQQQQRQQRQQPQEQQPPLDGPQQPQQGLQGEPLPVEGHRQPPGQGAIASDARVAAMLRLFEGASIDGTACTTYESRVEMGGAHVDAISLPKLVLQGRPVPAGRLQVWLCLRRPHTNQVSVIVAHHASRRRLNLPREPNSRRERCPAFFVMRYTPSHRLDEREDDGGPDGGSRDNGNGGGGGLVPGSPPTGREAAASATPPTSRGSTPLSAASERQRAKRSHRETADDEEGGSSGSRAMRPRAASASRGGRSTVTPSDKLTLHDVADLDHASAVLMYSEDFLLLARALAQKRSKEGTLLSRLRPAEQAMPNVQAWDAAGHARCTLKLKLHLGLPEGVTPERLHRALEAVSGDDGSFRASAITFPATAAVAPLSAGSGTHVSGHGRDDSGKGGVALEPSAAATPAPQQAPRGWPQPAAGPSSDFAAALATVLSANAKAGHAPPVAAEHPAADRRRLLGSHGPGRDPAASGAPLPRATAPAPTAWGTGGGGEGTYASKFRQAATAPPLPLPNPLLSSPYYWPSQVAPPYGGGVGSAGAADGGGGGGGPGVDPNTTMLAMQANFLASMAGSAYSSSGMMPPNLEQLQMIHAILAAERGLGVKSAGAPTGGGGDAGPQAYAQPQFAMPPFSWAQGYAGSTAPGSVPMMSWSGQPSPWQFSTPSLSYGAGAEVGQRPGPGQGAAPPGFGTGTTQGSPGQAQAQGQAQGAFVTPQMWQHLNTLAYQQGSGGGAGGGGASSSRAGGNSRHGGGGTGMAPSHSGLYSLLRRYAEPTEPAVAGGSAALASAAPAATLTAPSGAGASTAAPEAADSGASASGAPAQSSAHATL